VGAVKPLGDAAQPGLLPAAQVGAGMHDQVGDAQRLAVLQFDDVCLQRFLPHRFVGRTEIDEVGVMGHDGPDARLLLFQFEPLDFL
jgi:hypothetical protein